MSEHENLLEYWRQPDDPANQPEEYLSGAARSKFLLSVMSRYIPKSMSIMELGCNVGRNLNALYEAGYTKLIGIEVNKDALDIGRLHYPLLYQHMPMINASIQQHLAAPLLPINCIFTLAVLEHVPPSSEWVLRAMAYEAKHIITIEDETTESWKHFPRNYRTVFEAFGMHQIYEQPAPPDSDLLPSFVARVFRSQDVQAA